MEESRMEGSGVWTVAGRGDRDRKKRWAQCLLDGRCCQPGLGSSPKGVSICGKVIERGPSVGWVSKGIHLWGEGSRGGALFTRTVGHQRGKVRDDDKGH